MRQLTVPLLVAATLAAYVLVRWLAMRRPHPLFNVVVLSAALVACLLLATGTPLSDYAPAKDLMTFLLGPATVGLAVPLYRHRTLLRLYALPILASVAAGAATAMLCAGAIARLGGMPREVVMSILPKGVSIPFAVEIARLYDGVPPLAAAFVVATGTLGALVGAPFLTRAGVEDPVARGLALGTVSHAQGTAAALQEGEAQGSMAGLAMILAGVFTALFAPLAVWLLG
ncbi:Inner membrane protein YohK [Fundidesulfovibrio magnetotacticus]|uniref:Inner membrane protein YohK n=1 Tax=Fundidesulfovibrio magnetotacticus TaxID=2730080 RepID=A0A6V8LYW0_9BACT|nr:LrgB family protein [Fundidesulfovibrio magnetotacticus]GFK95418.1 Inner membrane protein YohK [Fundidesulfovibrio magnetotacticus]